MITCIKTDQGQQAEGSEIVVGFLRPTAGRSNDQRRYSQAQQQDDNRQQEKAGVWFTPQIVNRFKTF